MKLKYLLPFVFSSLAFSQEITKENSKNQISQLETLANRFIDLYPKVRFEKKFPKTIDSEMKLYSFSLLTIQYLDKENFRLVEFGIGSSIVYVSLYPSMHFDPDIDSSIFNLSDLQKDGLDSLDFFIHDNSLYHITSDAPSDFVRGFYYNALERILSKLKFNVWVLEDLFREKEENTQSVKNTRNQKFGPYRKP